MSVSDFARFAAVVAVAVTLTACGGGTQEGPAAEPAPVVNPVDPATAGSITGTIAFEGTPPPARPISMASDPNCGAGGTTETVVVGSAGGLKNVFVYVKDGLGGLKFPVPSTPVVLDQQGCRYVPHVLGIQAGQPLEVLNSDATLHNVHAVPKTNREFNTGQPIKGMRHTHTFSTVEVMVPFKCDVHNWMSAYVGVLDHPFYAVTGDDGSFQLKGLPPGTYTVEAWHETLGTQTQTVTIGPQETSTLAFTFKG
jgi:plastocyanin